MSSMRAGSIRAMLWLVVVMGGAALLAPISVSAAPMAGIAPGGRSVVEFPGANIRFTMPPAPWERLPDQAVPPDAVAVFARTQPMQQLLIASEALGETDLPDNRQLVEALQTRFRGNVPDARFTVPVPLRVGGVSGLRFVQRGTVNGNPMTTICWTGGHRGYAYRMILITPQDDEDAAMRDADALFAGFAPLDAQRQVVTHDPGLNFLSRRFRYRVSLDAATWRFWAKHDTEAEYSDYAAMSGNDTAMAVWAVSLDGPQVEQDAVVTCLLSMMSFAPEDLSDVEEIKQDGRSGIAASARRTMDGKRYAYALRLVQDEHAAYLIAAWTSRFSNRSRLTAALDAVQLPDAANAKPRPPSAREAVTQGDFYNNLGLHAFNRMEYDRAAACFRVAHELNASKYVHFENIVTALTHAGRQEEALATLLAGAKRYPFRADLHLGAARVARDLGRTDQAMELFEKALNQNCADDAAAGEYAQMMVAAERFDRALKVIDEYSIRFNTASVAMARAALLAGKGDRDKAIGLLKVQLAGGFDVAIARDLVVYMTDAERYDDALHVIDLLEKETGQTLNVLLFRGIALLGQAHYEQAKRTFETAKALYPSEPAVEEWLRHTSNMLGQGRNFSVQTDITPVPIPAALLEVSDTVPPDARQAQILNSIVAISFVPGVEDKRTDYLRVRIIDQQGVEAYSSMEVSFDAVAERCYVNKAEVRDETGALIWEGVPSDYYVLDDPNAMGASNDQVLHVPVAGLRPGCTFEFMTTTDSTAADRKRYVARYFVHGFVTTQSAFYITGDRARLSIDASEGLIRKEIGDGVAWIAYGLAPFRPEPSMDDLRQFLPRVIVGDNRDTWASEANDYLSDIERLLEPDAQIVKLAERLTADAPDQPARVRALLRHVQSEYAYNAILFGPRAMIPQPASKIVHNRYGDCKDHALLLVHLLRAAGVEAHPALISTSGAIVEPVPSLEQFDHAIVYAPALGQWYDCTNKDDDPLLGAALRLAGHQALVIDPANPRLERIPVPEAQVNGLEAVRTVRVGVDGTARVTETLTLHGALAGDARGSLRYRNGTEQADQIEGWLTVMHPRVWLESAAVENADRPDQPLVLRIKYVLPRCFNVVPGQIVGQVPALWERWHLTPYNARDRRTPFRIDRPLRCRTEVTLMAPDGYHVTVTPDAHDTSGAYATSRAAFDVVGNTLRGTFDCDVHPGVHPAAAYARYLRAQQEIVDQLEQSFVFEADE